MSESPAPRPSRPLPPVAIVIGVLFFFGLLGLMIYGVMKSGDPQRDVLPSALIDKPAPAFALPVLHDPEMIVHSDDLRGAPYLLNVWGSWCAACREEHPVLTRFAESKRVRVIGYNWKDDPNDALHWLEQLGNPFMVVLSDIEGRTAIDWGVTAAPETFLVDGSGIVRWKYSGAMTQRVVDEKLVPALEKIEKAQGHAGSPLHGALSPCAGCWRCCWYCRWPHWPSNRCTIRSRCSSATVARNAASMTWPRSCAACNARTSRWPIPTHRLPRTCAARCCS